MSKKEGRTYIFAPGSARKDPRGIHLENNLGKNQKVLPKESQAVTASNDSTQITTISVHFGFILQPQSQQPNNYISEYVNSHQSTAEGNGASRSSH